MRPSTFIAVAAVAAVVVVAAIVAFAASGSQKAGVSPPGMEQTQPVVVAGPPLQSLPGTGTDPTLGSIAPTLVGQSFDGTAVTVHPGRATLLVFVAHWCPHCRREVPLLVKWQQAGGVPADVDVVGISTSSDDHSANFPPSAWLSTAGFPWPVLADSDGKAAAKAFGLEAFPYFVLLDATGHVAWRATGEFDTAKLTSTITEALTK
jgi:cytochrome c biogenesis protein CcmG/thiol:disulfide interchange protein DsbE